MSWVDVKKNLTDCFNGQLACFITQPTTSNKSKQKLTALYLRLTVRIQLIRIVICLVLLFPNKL